MSYLGLKKDGCCTCWLHMAGGCSLQENSNFKMSMPGYAVVNGFTVHYKPITKVIVSTLMTNLT